MSHNVLATMVTTTSYGSWLPGDARGYVQGGRILPPNPQVAEHAQCLLLREPVCFSESQQSTLFHALRTAATEFGYQLTDVAVESWHLHWIVNHGFDTVPIMAGRLKTRMRQALSCGRVWTKGYCHRCLYTEHDIEAARQYIARHDGCGMLDGKPVNE